MNESMKGEFFALLGIHVNMSVNSPQQKKEKTESLLVSLTTSVVSFFRPMLAPIAQKENIGRSQGM